MVGHEGFTRSVHDNGWRTIAASLHHQPPGAAKDHLRPPGDAKLGIDPAQMRLNRPLTDAQLMRDALGALAVSYQRRNLQLPRREHLCRVSVSAGRRLELLDDPEWLCQAEPGYRYAIAMAEAGETIVGWTTRVPVLEMDLNEEPMVKAAYPLQAWS